MHITVSINSVTGLPEDSSVIYLIGTMGQQTFKTGLFRIQKTGEQRHVHFSSVCGTLYSATPAPLRLMLVEACEFGDYCLALTTIQPAELTDGAGPRTIVMEPCSQSYNGPKPTISLSFCEKAGASNFEVNQSVMTIECPQTEAVRTDRMNIKLAPYGETFLKYDGLPPVPTNLNALQAAVRRRSLDAGMAVPMQDQDLLAQLPMMDMALPAPEQATETIQEVQKPRRNSLMDTVVDKISTVSANINKASAPILHSVDNSLNRGLNKLNEFVGSLTENNSQQRYQAAFPEIAKSETLLAEFQCDSLAPTGKLFSGYLFLTTHSLLFVSKEVAPTIFRFRMELVNILSMCRILVNGCDAIQIFDLNHNMVQLQHFGNIGTHIAEGVCNTIPTPLLNNSLSQPLNNSLFSKAFKQVEAAWQSRAEMPPPEFRYATNSQMPILSS